MRSEALFNREVRQAVSLIKKEAMICDTKLSCRNLKKDTVYPVLGCPAVGHKGPQKGKRWRISKMPFESILPPSLPPRLATGHRRCANLERQHKPREDRVGSKMVIFNDFLVPRFRGLSAFVLCQLGSRKREKNPKSHKGLGGRHCTQPHWLGED